MYASTNLIKVIQVPDRIHSYLMDGERSLY